MSRLVSCPRCDETEELDGVHIDQSIIIRCQQCHLEWERDLTPRCATCGSEDVRPAFEAVVEKSRGSQLSMQSARLVYLCVSCDGAKLADYHRTSSPLMPAELPTRDEHDI